MQEEKAAWTCTRLEKKEREDDTGVGGVVVGYRVGIMLRKKRDRNKPLLMPN